MRDIEKRVKKLERGMPPAPPDLKPLAADVFAKALSAADGLTEDAAFCTAVQGTGPAFQQACDLRNAAYKIGFEKVGYQDDSADYIEAAVPAMFPEPHSPAVAAMVAVMRGDLEPRPIRLITVSFRRPTRAPDPLDLGQIEKEPA